jgi:hypothetical protein
MALFDSIKNLTVNTVMAQNKGLSKITSTTFSITGTSVNSIQTNAVSSVNSSLGNTDYNSQLYSPITQMSSYALSTATTQTQQDAINTATQNAYSAVDASFNSAFPTATANTLYDIQSASTGAIGTGINNFGTALGSINASIVAPALSIGNSAFVTAGQISDNICTNVFNTATNAVNSSVASINSSVASIVAAKNSVVNAASSAASSLASAINGDTASTSSANPYVSAGVSAVDEGTSDGTTNNTDVIYQNVKLFIEGVQVPFEAISISQGIGTLPTASIQIPPDPGLLDIARYYQPKVHIFYTDSAYGGDRLLFWGHIVVANYSKSRSQGSASISFHCEHKNALLSTVTLEFAGYASNATTDISNQNPDQATAKVNNLNSTLAIISALQGLTGVQASADDLLDPSNKNVSNADVSKLAQRFVNFENRLIGMPSAIMNFWNQLKKECYQNVILNTVMADMYIPLVEDGLAFFDRLAGHYVIETLIDTTKEDYCPGGVTPASTAKPVMIPPAYRLNSLSAIKSSLSVNTVTNMLGFSGELTNFLQMFSDFYTAVEYEILTLASPAEIPVDPTASYNPDDVSALSATTKMAIETIVKPQVPFYYSPICNVLFPKMYHTINISQDESQIPSRLTAFSDIIPGSQGQIGSHYYAPNSVREAVAYGAVMANKASGTSNLPVNLIGTTGQSFNVPGKYEVGRGIRHKRITLPNWLAQLVKGKMQDQSNPNNESWPAKTDPDYKALCDLHAAWVDRYGYDRNVYDDNSVEYVRNTDKDVLDPYSQKSSIQPFQRLLFAAADFEYTKAVVASRSGNVEALFNPYIVPGYPMEVLDDSPNSPSFHAMCSSVTHTFTSRSIGTSIGMIAVCTYTEMVNYYMQPIHPWLQTALNIVNTAAGDSGKTSIDGDGYGNPPDDLTINSTIIGNDVAKTTADSFYLTTLGVNSVSIDDLYDFDFGQVVPQKRTNGLLVESTNTPRIMANGGDSNDFNTAVGNLRLVRRPIEGRKSIEAKFGLTFIDLNTTNYNPTAIQYQNPNLDDSEMLEPGASIFLDYEEVADFISNSQSDAATSSTTTSATTGSGAPIAFG